MLQITIPQFPQRLQIHLFQNITNAKEIKTGLLSGSPSHDFSFINPHVILSKEHLLSACYRALLEYNGGKIRTKSIHAEVLFCLGSSGNIIDSLTRFGIKDDSDLLIVIKVVEKEGDETYDLSGVIDGIEVEWDDLKLREGIDFKQLQKCYKFQPSVSSLANEKLTNEEWTIIEKKAVAATQLRGC